MPKVSVIVPIYGVEKFIERCARSLFEQTLDDLEFIFVDDCTKDNSICILTRIINEYPHRKSQTIIVKHEVNKGLPQARKTGISYATGDFIIHCDSDDWVEPTAYLEMYELAQREKHDIVVCDYFRSDGDSDRPGYSLNERYYDTKDAYFRAVLSQVHGLTSVWNKLVRRSLYLDNDIYYPVINMWEDFVLESQLIFYAKSVGYCKKSFYHYFVNKGSMCSSYVLREKLNQIHQNTNIILDFLLNHLKINDYKSEIQMLKYRSRFYAEPHLNSSYKEWRSIYPEIDPMVFFNKLMTSNDKVRYIAIHCHLFPILRKIRKRI